MSIEVVRSGFDTWTEAAKPFTRHPKETHYRVRFGNNLAYLWMKSPAPLGATVTRATLVLQMRGAQTGSRVLNVHRVTSSWKEGGTHWNNQPAGADPVQVTIPSYVNGRDVEVDVTNIVQSWANGTPNYGFRLSTDSTTTIQIYAMASTAHPTLTVEWSDAPAKPTDLKPSEAATGLSHPHLTFSYLDVSGNTELQAVQVQINSTISMTSPDFDSGEVQTLSSGLDLAETSFAGLADDETAYWRIRAKDGAGLWSVWSDIVSMSRRDKPQVTIENMGAGVVYDPSPPIIWSIDGDPVIRYRVLVFNKQDLTRSVYDSKEIQSSEVTHTIPFGVLQDGEEYRVTVRVWDGWNRESTPGDPRHTEDSADFTLEVDDTVGPVTGLTAVQDGVTPWVVLTWHRSTTPDGFVLLRDGKNVAQWEPDDVFVGGDTYSYTATGSRPNRTQTYEVRAVVNGAQSASNDVISYAVPVEGIWLRDIRRGIDVTLWGDDPGSWETTDDASVYTPIGGTQVVRVVSGMRGLEGSLSGFLIEGWGKTLEELEEDLYAIKSEPSRKVQIVAGDESFQALIGNVNVAPTPQTRAGLIVKAVSFDFWQVDSSTPWQANI